MMKSLCFVLLWSSGFKEEEAQCDNEFILFVSKSRPAGISTGATLQPAESCC